MAKKGSNAGLSAKPMLVKTISKNLERGLVGLRWALVRVLPNYALSSISAHQALLATPFLHLATNSVPSPWRSAWGGTSSLTQEQFRLEPEAPRLTVRLPARGELLEGLSGRSAAAVRVTDLGT